MPKLSKRKRQLKEIHNRKGENPENPMNEEDDDDVEEESVEETSPAVPNMAMPTAGLASENLPAIRGSQRQANAKQAKAQQQALEKQQNQHRNVYADQYDYSDHPYGHHTSNNNHNIHNNNHNNNHQQSNHATHNNSNNNNNAATHTTHTNNTDTNITSNTANNNNENSNGVWVQCNLCEKWRLLPSHVIPESLPEVWTCDQNIFDPLRNHCAAPEEDYSREEEMAGNDSRQLGSQDIPGKVFVAKWLRKLKNTERAENRFISARDHAAASSAAAAAAMMMMNNNNHTSGSGTGSNSGVTRGNPKNKRFRGDCEWIQCCNPYCGKWRAVSRNLDVNTILKRLHTKHHTQYSSQHSRSSHHSNNNNNNHARVKSGGWTVDDDYYSSGVGSAHLWYCAMNSWDDDTASCAAPQEPLFNCKWNLIRTANNNNHNNHNNMQANDNSMLRAK
jgi:hypothetical protein